MEMGLLLRSNKIYTFALAIALLMCIPLIIKASFSDWDTNATLELRGSLNNVVV